MKRRTKIKQGSALAFVIAGLIPYTEPNLKLTFKPGLFFKELAQKSGMAESTLKNALVQAKHENLIAYDGSNYSLKKDAKVLMDRYKKLEATPLKSGYMLVLFDIPQSHDIERRRFVQELKSLRFKQIQKSVWANDHDNRDIILDIISELKIGRYVAITLTHPVFGSHHFEN